MAILTAIGLMSGTSLDGVDVALIESDGELIEHLGPTGYRAYTGEESEVLRAALAAAVSLQNRKARPGVLAEAEKIVTDAHAGAVESFLQENKIEKNQIAIVGFHGQTVLHRPSARLTVQIGDGKQLAKKISLPVAYDFRAADVTAGGEGAPLVPVFHRALASGIKENPLAIVNIGGVAKITYLDGGADPIAFDTGPGNAPIDDLMQARKEMARDEGGALAARGRVHEETVARVLADSFFAQLPTK